MSDHGAGPIVQVVDLDLWLEQEGMLHFLSKRDWRSVFSSIGKWGMGLAQRYLPWRAKGFLKRAVGTTGRVESFLLYSDLDWTHTQAFSIGNQGNICINLQGREPQGIVPPDEYEAVRDKIITRLNELRDPDTGEPIVERVYRREELYQGDQVELAPDLLIRWRDDEYLAKKDIDTATGQIFRRDLKFGRFASDAALDQTGTHKLHGILILHGDAVTPGSRIEGAQLADLAPTILYLMDEAIPGEMDGRVLLEPLKEALTSARQMRHAEGEEPGNFGGGSYVEEDEEIVRERLRGLGYVA